MATKTEILTAVENLAPGKHPAEAAVLEQARENAIMMAIMEYARLRPRTMVEDVAGTGSHDIPVLSITGWVEIFSHIDAIEYPIVDGEDNALESDLWRMYQTPSGWIIRFMEAAPLTSEMVRITYTVGHVLNDDETTIPDHHIPAVTSLAASFYCARLAVIHAQESDPTMLVDHMGGNKLDTKTNRYAKMAAQYKAEFYNFFGEKPGKQKAACAVTEWDVDYPGGADRLTHSRRWR